MLEAAFLSLLILTGCNAALFEDNKRLCVEDNMVACFNLGIMYMKGIRGAEKSESIALEYFRKACNGGDIDGCLNAGKYFEEGEEVRKDLFKAVEFYYKACEGKEPYACMVLGDFYRERKEVIKKDRSKALYYYKKVCEDGYSIGCSEYDKLRK